MSSKIHEKCAVAATLVVGDKNNASTLVYEILFALQHRGTEASGMASQMPSGEVERHFAPGLVRDVYDDRDVAARLMPGNPVIGHNRYSTSGSKNKHAQPFIDDSVGFAFAHNGNLPDTDKLEKFLGKRNLLHKKVNDSEMMGLAIVQFLREGNDLANAVIKAYPLFIGAFSCVAMQDGVLVAFRDRCGIRPLAIGRLSDGSYAISSETCGLDAIGALYEREVKPGELVVIDKTDLKSHQLAKGQEKLDIFEFVYFARHDSRLYGQSVNEVRRGLGKQLAVEHGLPAGLHNDAIVVPVPDTSIPEAEGFAEALGLKQRQLIVKSRYIGRTFMQTSDKERKEQLRLKHNIIDTAVEGKDIILIDDSIVRLNTIPRLVKLAKNAGARSVSVLVGSPPVRFPDFYGIDTPKQSELAAANMTIKQMQKTIGCKYLGFLSLPGMIKATSLPASNFSLSCFTGNYPIDIGHRKKEVTPPVSLEYIA